MIRLILFVFLCFGFANGWLVFNSTKFWNDIGFSSFDQQQPINWKEYIIDTWEK